MANPACQGKQHAANSGLAGGRGHWWQNSQRKDDMKMKQMFKLQENIHMYQFYIILFYSLFWIWMCLDVLLPRPFSGKSESILGWMQWIASRALLKRQKYPQHQAGDPVTTPQLKQWRLSFEDPNGPLASPPPVSKEDVLPAEGLWRWSWWAKKNTAGRLADGWEMLLLRRFHITKVYVCLHAIMWLKKWLGRVWRIERSAASQPCKDQGRLGTLW